MEPEARVVRRARVPGYGGCCDRRRAAGTGRAGPKSEIGSVLPVAHDGACARVLDVPLCAAAWIPGWEVGVSVSLPAMRVVPDAGGWVDHRETPGADAGPEIEPRVRGKPDLRRDRPLLLPVGRAK